jgi:arsenate reductase
MEEVTRVLFVCVHNAARSQMAEALLRQLGGERFIVESAGFEPAPINPLAIAVMADIGIDISGAKTQAVFDLFREGRRYDYVISVCDAATAERCPIFPGFTKRIAWSFADPSAFQGKETERLEQTVIVREAIHKQIKAWLNELGGHAKGAKP